MQIAKNRNLGWKKKIRKENIKEKKMKEKK